MQMVLAQMPGEILSDHFSLFCGFLGFQQKRGGVYGRIMLCLFGVDVPFDRLADGLSLRNLGHHFRAGGKAVFGREQFRVGSVFAEHTGTGILAQRFYRVFPVQFSRKHRVERSLAAHGSSGHVNGVCHDSGPGFLGPGRPARRAFPVHALLQLFHGAFFGRPHQPGGEIPVRAGNAQRIQFLPCHGHKLVGRRCFLNPRLGGEEAIKEAADVVVELHPKTAAVFVNRRQPTLEAAEDAVKLTGRGFAFPQIRLEGTGKIFVFGDLPRLRFLGFAQVRERFFEPPPQMLIVLCFQRGVVIEAGQLVVHHGHVGGQTFVGQTGLHGPP